MLLDAVRSNEAIECALHQLFNDARTSVGTELVLAYPDQGTPKMAYPPGAAVRQKWRILLLGHAKWRCLVVFAR